MPIPSPISVLLTSVSIHCSPCYVSEKFLVGPIFSVPFLSKFIPIRMFVLTCVLCASINFPRVMFCWFVMSILLNLSTVQHHQQLIFPICLIRFHTHTFFSNPSRSTRWDCGGIAAVYSPGFDLNDPTDSTPPVSWLTALYLLRWNAPRLGRSGWTKGGIIWILLLRRSLWCGFLESMCSTFKFLVSTTFNTSSCLSLWISTLFLSLSSLCSWFVVSTRP